MYACTLNLPPHPQPRVLWALPHPCPSLCLGTCTGIERPYRLSWALHPTLPGGLRMRSCVHLFERGYTSFVGAGELVEGCPAGRRAGVCGFWKFLLVYSSSCLTCSILFGEGRVGHGLMMFVSCVSIKYVCLVTHRLSELTGDILGEAGPGCF